MSARIPQWRSGRLEEPVTEGRIPPVPFRGAFEQELERVKSRLLERLQQEPLYAGLEGALCQAANEAAALAWMTPFPFLVLPVLMEEKAETLRYRTQRQLRIYLRSQLFPPDVEGVAEPAECATRVGAMEERAACAVS